MSKESGANTTDDANVIDPSATAREEDMSEEEFDDMVEAIDSGDLRIEQDEANRQPDVEDIEKFLKGEITWAQLQKMSADDAYQIAAYGYKLYEESKFHDAKTIFEGLVMANPYDPYFHTMCGATYQQIDEHEKALEQYSLAIELDPKHLHAYVNRAELLLVKGELVEALKDLRTACEVEPESEEPAARRARTLLLTVKKAIEETEA